MAKVTPDKLEEALNKILDDYAEDAEKTLSEAAKEAGKAGVQALQAASRSTFGGTGAYASGWTLKAEKVAGGSDMYTIWNAKKPGLPHLLEHGHANRNGGRTPGRVHIAPIEEELFKSFEDQVRADL